MEDDIVDASYFVADDVWLGMVVNVRLIIM